MGKEVMCVVCDNIIPNVESKFPCYCGKCLLDSNLFEVNFNSVCEELRKKIKKKSKFFPSLKNKDIKTCITHGEWIGEHHFDLYAKAFTLDEEETVLGSVNWSLEY